jgi:translocator protein
MTFGCARAYPPMGETKFVGNEGVDMNGGSVLRGVAAVTACLSAGVVGTLIVPRGGFTSWYAILRKPAFTPPSWVFGPVWTGLYSLMGIAAFLVWQKGLGFRAVRVALSWFLVQLVLNALWAPVFFGRHRIRSALAIVTLLWAAIAVTMSLFWRISRPAGLLLVPYFGWVSFATVLNASIWRRNR